MVFGIYQNAVVLIYVLRYNYMNFSFVKTIFLSAYTISRERGGIVLSCSIFVDII
jgi:hypothetical protein